MKKIGIISFLAALILQAFSQEVTAVNKVPEKQFPAADTIETARVIIGDKLLVVEDNNDAFRMKIGNRGISILESLENKGPKIEFKKFNDKDSDLQDNKDNKKDDRERKKNRFRGHWSGVDFGFNNYLTSDHSLTLPAGIDYMTLHSGKSSNFNINFSQLSLGITKHFGFVTGLGLNWNNYRFDGNNNIQKGTTGVIEMLDPGASLKKSKLTTLYMHLPFMAEIQIPVDNSHINIAAGPIGAVKLGSHSKMVYEDGDKVKSDSDFSLAMLRGGATARVGYENFQIYGTYYMTPLFKSEKGPSGTDLYPFEIGISFTFND
jgi:hypothetical protein